jgi:phosphoribosylformimino-5-aminoimidazole carboxamide ribotide isomerase
VIALPAIDLREGACVQLVGGSYADERVRLADPLAVARGFQAAGFHALHAVDLDGATGRGSNAAALRALLSLPGLAVQVGGGVRDERAVGEWLAAGAHRVLVGTRALEDPEWLAAAAAAHPERLIVAADASGRHVLTRGWQRRLERDLLQVVDELNPLPLAGVLVTAVDREGRQEGPDLPLLAEVVARSRLPVLAAGGIATLEDLRSLARRGAAAAVVGMALYSGALDPQQVAEEFAT